MTANPGAIVGKPKNKNKKFFLHKYNAVLIDFEACFVNFQVKSFKLSQEFDHIRKKPQKIRILARRDTRVHI